ncbi:MAG: hypothetical protein SH856_08500 [Flavobacteriales bacterium]|nr:hypothetical protein [Flavobacteriales bacterium]
MRTIFITTIILISTQLQSQIAVKSFEKELTCNVDSLRHVAKVKATSPCGIVDIAWKDQNFSGGCAGTLVRTYTFSDQCGATATAEQYISLMDTSPPVLLGVPSSVEVFGEEIPPSAQVTAMDNNKSSCEVIFSEKKEGNRIMRTWSSKDSCENVSTGTQVITIKPKS